MKSGVVDELQLHIEPFVIGTDVKLFSDESFERQLKLVGVKKVNRNALLLRYRVL